MPLVPHLPSPLQAIGFAIDNWFKSAVLQVFVHDFLLLFHNFFDFVILPDLVPLQESGIAWNQVSFAFFYHGFEGAFYVDLNFLLLSLLISLFEGL